MALNNAIRRAASRVVPLVIAGSQRYLHHSRSSAILNQELLRRQFPSLLHSYSKMSEAHESLIQALEFEIVKSPDGHLKEDAVPEGFSFEIQDRSGQKTITLTREFEGETINIEVHMPSFITGKESGTYEEWAITPSIPLVVRVSKGNGPSLELGCTAYPDKIAIYSLSIKDPDDQIAYKGPDFTFLDWNVQKAIYRYLVIRGITPKTTNFLHAYMSTKHTRDYITWMKKFKWFVEA